MLIICRSLETRKNGENRKKGKKLSIPLYRLYFSLPIASFGWSEKRKFQFKWTFFPFSLFKRFSCFFTFHFSSWALFTNESKQETREKIIFNMKSNSVDLKVEMMNQKWKVERSKKKRWKNAKLNHVFSCNNRLILKCYQCLYKLNVQLYFIGLHWM